MHRCYGATEAEPRDLRLRQIHDALFTDHPCAHALLAWDDGRAVGFAAYSFLWPAVGLSRSLCLKELYMSQAARRRGTGKLLMHTLYEIAAASGCTRPGRGPPTRTTPAPSASAQSLGYRSGRQALLPRRGRRADRPPGAKQQSMICCASRSGAALTGAAGGAAGC